LGWFPSNSSVFWTVASDWLNVPIVQGHARSLRATESCSFRLMTNAKCAAHRPTDDGPCVKRTGKWLEGRESKESQIRGENTMKRKRLFYTGLRLIILGCGISWRVRGKAWG